MYEFGKSNQSADISIEKYHNMQTNTSAGNQSSERMNEAYPSYNVN